MEPEDRILTDNDIESYNKHYLCYVRDKDPVYTIVARAISCNIKGGNNIEIEIYLTGLGIPDSNKLILLWSFSNVIDPSSKGVFIYCIKEFVKEIKNKRNVFPLFGEQYLEKQYLDPTGLSVNLNKGYFLPIPSIAKEGGKKSVTSQIMGESKPDGHPPIRILLMTLKNAKAGDYEIDIVLTYVYKDSIKQTSDKIRFHITSFWDRNQWWIVSLGTLIAFVLLIMAFLSNWCFN